MKIDALIDWVKAEINAGNRCLLVLHDQSTSIRDALDGDVYVCNLSTATSDDFAKMEMAESACVIELRDREVAFHNLHARVARLPPSLRKQFRPSLGPVEIRSGHMILNVLDARTGATRVYASEGMNGHTFESLRAEAGSLTYFWNCAPSRKIAAIVPNGPHLLSLLRRGWSTVPYHTMQYVELCGETKGWERGLNDYRNDGAVMSYWGVAPYRSDDCEHYGALITMTNWKT